MVLRKSKITKYGIYKLFGDESKENEVKNFLSNEVNSELLVYAMLGAIELGQTQYVNLIMNHIKDKEPEFEARDTKVIFNCAIKCNNLKLLELLNNKFSVIDTLKEKVYVRINNIGKVEELGMMPMAETSAQAIKDNYVGNPLLFSLTNFNIEALDFLLSKCQDINPSVVENAFVESCVLENSNAVFYLTEHSTTREVLNKSKTITAFLNEKTELYEIKEKAKTSLAMMNLKDELPENSTINKPKLKM